MTDLAVVSPEHRSAILSQQARAVRAQHSAELNEQATHRAAQYWATTFERFCTWVGIVPADATPDTAIQFIMNMVNNGKLITKTNKRVPYSRATIAQADWALVRWFALSNKLPRPIDLRASQDYVNTVAAVLKKPGEKNERVNSTVRRAVTITLDEAKLLADHWGNTNRGVMMRLYVALALSTGARIQSLHELKWKDIKFVGNSMRISFDRWKAKPQGWTITVDPWPTQPLLCPVQAYKDWKARVAAAMAPEDEHVFRAIYKGGAIGYHNRLTSMHRMIKALGDSALGFDISGHSFRRTLLSYANKGGASGDDQINVSGHTDVRTLNATYHADALRKDAQLRTLERARAAMEDE